MLDTRTTWTWLILGLLLLPACEGFLDRAPLNQYTSENYWEDETQITLAVNAIYPILRSQYTGPIWRFGEFRSDNTTFQYNELDRGGMALEQLDYFLAEATLGDIGGLWNSCYTAIARANFLLASIETAAFTQEANRVIREAEARFLRAFMYYHLVIHYGDVPLVLEVVVDEAEALAKGRDPVDAIYAEAIIPDLTFAIEHLPAVHPPAEKGRATRAAAQVLLAKAHFARRDYAAALPLLDAVVNSGAFSLMNQYRDVFDPAFKSANPEVIFAAAFATSANQGSGFMIGWLPFNSGSDITQGVNPSSRAGLNIPTRDMIAAYEPGDARLAASVGFYVDRGDTTPYVRKYVFPPIEAGGTNVDWPIFRYADVLLMQAEARLELQGGLPDPVFETINQLRARAGLPFIYPGNPDPKLDVQSEDDLRAFLRRERRVELAFESARWQDLRRYGTVEAVMQAHGIDQRTYQDFLAAFPDAYTRIPELIAIPAFQALQYGYPQNPGW